MSMKKRLFVATLLFMFVIGAFAQRTTDMLDRGLVAVPSGSGAFVSWRIFGEEYYDTEYNLYRNGQKVNDTPLKVSNYVDANGKAGSKYQVAAVVRGVEQAKSAEVTRLGQQYIQFAVKNVKDRKGNDITNDYSINDIALADVDGDGVSEFIVKRNYVDGSSVNATAFNLLECYNIKGDRLWYIDLGPNMVSGPDEQYDAVGYDWDGDGKAEILMRGADNMIIYHSDGTTTNIGNMNVNTRNTVNQTANMTYTNTGAEYLLYLEGATGKPYPIGSGSTPNWMTYPLARGNANDWGDGYGHRSTKHYFGAPFLDGRKPYIFLGRGCYTRHMMKTYSVNPETHKLTLYWSWEDNNGWGSPYYGQGYHNFGIADVDWDGRDEIVFGSMVIDDNGKGLSTTGLGHGDAQHCSDFDPYRHGQEIFDCNEDHPAMNYRDATTSKIYYRLQSTSDDGRALCGNFSDAYPGAIGHSSQSGTISCVADKPISGGPGGFTNNFRIYWDGDLLEEGLDGASSREGAARVFKADGSIVFTADGTANCNWTKNTPSATGDILGDWREEIIVRTSDNKYIRVYTTNMRTEYRNYTLWHDHQYRQGMVWESIGYNQPPHASYFLGKLENITIAPPPLTMTDRTEVANNGTINASLNDKHVIVCETNDTKITVADGAKPWIVTFNVPSWVQGTNSTVTNGNAKINYTYYTCDVTGSAFSGSMRLIKQGDGILNLPKVDMTYTGETNIWAGTVNFDGTLKNSSLWLNRFAVLNSDGGVFRSIKMDYDSKLRPGRADSKGTITTDSLLLGFGSRVIFDFFDDFTADQVNTKLLTIETKNWQYGPKYLMPVFEFVGHSTEKPVAGKYLIGSVEELKGNLSDIRIEGITSSVKASVELEDGKLYLVINSMRDSGDITWTGSESAIWDVASTENFKNDNGEGLFFVSGDNVLFNDEAVNKTVTINNEIEAGVITVDNTQAYTFKGNGALIGNTSLVKKGTGNLTISTENTYTGGNRLSGGVTIVSSLANTNQAKGNLGAMTTAASKFIIENGAELRTTAAVTNGSFIKFESEQGGIINNTADFIADRAMSGTLLTKKGAGWLKLNNSNTALNKMIIAAGTVQCINANVPAKTVEFQGGRLDENTGTGYAISVAKGKTGTWNTVNDATYTNAISGEGTLTVSCPVRKGGTNPNYWYATRTHLALDFSNFSGTLIPTSNGDPGGRFTLDTGKGMPNGTMNIPQGVVVLNTAKNFRIGKLTGNGELGGISDFGNGTGGANTWQIGYDQNATNSGVKVTANSNFVKVGSGKLTWSAASTNSGTSTISEGELTIMTSGKLGTGKLIIAQNGILSGTTTNNNMLTNSSTEVNGTIRPGTYEGASTGAINFGNNNVTFNANSQLVIGASRAMTSSSNGCTAIEGIATLTMNGTITVIPTRTHTLVAGDVIRIWKAETVAGTPIVDQSRGIIWDTTRLNEGLLVVKEVSLGINDMHSNAVNENDIYDLRGRLVRKNATSTIGLPEGIYIRGGKKIFVK